MLPHERPRIGLVTVPTHQLENLFRRCVRDELPSPLTKAALMTMGYNDVAEVADLFRDLDGRAVRAVLVAVLAERKARGG